MGYCVSSDINLAGNYIESLYWILLTQILVKLNPNPHMVKLYESAFEMLQFTLQLIYWYMECLGMAWGECECTGTTGSVR